MVVYCSFFGVNNKFIQKFYYIIAIYLLAEWYKKFSNN